ncbi:MAG: Xaa-Pro peptidase family protein [Thaumarchaeota archaeon]|nr:Xaa-Pro peptidase family protein [Nitrososphaerota archaeon]
MVQPKFSMKRFTDAMDQKGLDFLVVTVPENIFYVTDLPVSPVSPNRLLNCVKNSSPAFATISKTGEVTLVVTSAAIELVQESSWVEDVRTYATGTYIVRPGRQIPKDVAADPLEAVARIVRKSNAKKVGLDMKYATVYASERLRSLLRDIEISDETLMFELLRMVKSKEELRRFKEANRILCAAIRKVMAETRVGIHERELQLVLKSAILRDGGDMWQQTSIAAGPTDGPNIYSQPTDRRIQKGDIIRIDVGCVYKGYTADLSRTLVVGKAPPEARKIYRVLQEAEERLIDACGPSHKASELHAIVVNYVKKNLDSKYTRGNVGHGVGVELYDRPFLSGNDDTQLQAGMTLSLEVPYHKFGLGGFNVEDSAIVTKDGCDIVSDLPRELIEVG